MRDPESELRTPLLYRDGRGVVLTEAGRRLSVRARSILAQIDEARREALCSAHRGLQDIGQHDIDRSRRQVGDRLIGGRIHLDLGDATEIVAGVAVEVR